MKFNKAYHPPLKFNKAIVKSVRIQKHLGLYLEEKVNFNHHLKERIGKDTKGIGVLR